MTYVGPLCDTPCCTHRNPVKSFKLDPRNFHERFALLCASCQRERGYKPVDHTRPAVLGTFVGGNRGRSGT